jgi:small subunit ribosomal protein S17
MGKRKEYIGTVLSDKMDKTIVVQVERLGKNPKYGRVNKILNKFKAHDEGEIADIGDVVKIQECRPLSKDKYFRVLEVVKKTKTAHLEIKEEIA